MNNNQDESRQCYCLPSADPSSKPLLKTLTISAGTHSFSLVLTHLAAFVIAKNKERTRLTMAFPTHRVTLEADNETGGVFKDIATGFYVLVREQAQTSTAPTPESEGTHAEGALRVLEVTKVTVARRPEYGY